jgi:2-C-methyl-D-erythritol 4-phosphate cytidylyltransferase
MAFVSVIVVAGGSGSRFGGEIPKQFLSLRGKPVLMHSLEAFNGFLDNGEIIVVLPPDQIDHWKDLVQLHDFSMDHKVVEGGTERYYSVRNGLSQISDKTELVAIHDGVRPLVNNDVIGVALNSAELYGSGIPAIPVSDSVRLMEDKGSRILDRGKLRLIQTPQCFRIELVRDAYKHDFDPSFTDDASVVEASGHRVHLSEGHRSNIKITRREDLKLAEFLSDHFKA